MSKNNGRGRNPEIIYPHSFRVNDLTTLRMLFTQYFHLNFGKAAFYKPKFFGSSIGKINQSFISVMKSVVYFYNYRFTIPQIGYSDKST